MKKLVSMVCIVAVSLVYSCKPSIEPSVEATEVAATTELQEVMYRGIKAMVRADFPERALAPKTLVDYVEYLKGIQAPGARLAASDIPNLSGQYVLDLMLEIKKGYPDLSKSPIPDKDMKEIRKNFPTIVKEEDVWKNHDAVFHFYNDLIREDALRKALKEGKPKTGSGRVANFEPMDLLAASPIYALWVGWPFIWMRRAQTDADHRVVTDVNNGMIPTSVPLPIEADSAAKVNHERGNAYRHSVWNALGVKYMIDAGVSRNGALDKMRDVGTTYEAMRGAWRTFVAANDALWNNPQQAFDNVPRSNETAMDLHNNLVGRTYMQNNISWGLFGLRRMPSYSQICDELRVRAVNASYYGPVEAFPNAIYAIHNPSDINDGFERLKWWSWDHTYRSLIYIKP